MRRSLLLLALAACGRDHHVDPQTSPERPAMMPLTPASAIDVSEGLSSPEAIVYDPIADRYLVSNIHGGPHDADDNGYISQISPDGQVVVQKWIDGEAPNVTLHAPRGMALHNDTLYVVDLDAVRLFDRKTGAPIANWPVPDPHFPNDIRVVDDNTILVTETAIHLLPTGPVAEGTPTIWKYDAAGNVSAFAQGEQLQGPNGLAVTTDGIAVATFMGTEVYRLKDGKQSTIATLPATLLDGLVGLPDGSLMVTSWKPRALWRVFPDGTFRREFGDSSFVGAASIDYDAKRGRLLIPLVLANKVLFEPYELPRPQDPG